MIDFMYWFTVVYSVQTSQSKLDIVCTHVYTRMDVQSRSRWPRGLRHGSTAARVLELRVRIPPGAWMSDSCDCCVLSGGGLRVGLSARPEESPTDCHVSECHREVFCTMDRRLMDKKTWPYNLSDTLHATDNNLIFLNVGRFRKT
jgi:hypothetical protein